MSNFVENVNLSHSDLENCSKKNLFFKTTNFNLLDTEKEIQSNRHIDVKLLEKVINEMKQIKSKRNPLQTHQEEKDIQDFLYANPDLLNMSEDESKRLLNIKETSNIFYKEKFNDWFRKTDFDEISYYSEFLYKFTLINEKSSVNEINYCSDIQKNLNQLNTKLEKDKQISENYSVLISIIEKFLEINIDNLYLKNKFLIDFSKNINEKMNSTNLLSLKVNDLLHVVFEKLEKILNDIENKILIEKIELKNNLDNNTKEIKNKLNEAFTFILNFSTYFKFSYGFLFLIKYLKKLNFEREFKAEINFDNFLQIKKDMMINEETKIDKRINTSEISFPINLINFRLDKLENKSDNYENSTLFKYIPNETSFCSFGNTIFFYNKIFGLIKLKYEENSNQTTFLEINPEAFNLKKGFIISLGKQENGIVAFIPFNYFYEETDDEISILFSDYINFIDEDLLNSYKDKINQYFVSLKNWMQNFFPTRDNQDENDLIYTNKKIKIPMNQTDGNKELKEKDLLKKILIHSKNNIIYCLRPILGVSNSTDINKRYFSTKYIYSVDIFDLEFSKNIHVDKHHLKSCIIKNYNKKILNKPEKYSDLYKILDNFDKNDDLKKFFVNASKLISVNGSGDSFIYDLLLENLEKKRKLENAQDYDHSFLTNKNCLVYMKFDNSKRDKKFMVGNAKLKADYLKTFVETNLIELNQLYVSNMEYENTLYEFSNIYFNIKNQDKSDNYKITIPNKIINININSHDKIIKPNEKNILSNAKCFENDNSLNYLLRTLALASVCKLDERNYLNIENIFTNNLIIFNDSQNLKLLLDLIFNGNNLEDEENLTNLFCCLNVLKLFVNNNSNLNWSFCFYFNSQEEMKIAITNIFNILKLLINELNKKSNNTILKNITFLLSQILIEIISRIYNQKIYYTELIGEMIQLMKTITHQKVFNELNVSMLKNIQSLFSKNNNYIVALLINEKTNRFIIDNLFNVIDRKENYINNQEFSNVFYKGSPKFENIINSEYYKIDLNLESILSEIVNTIIVKIFNSCLNYGNIKYENTLENILNKLFTGNMNEEEVNKYKLLLIRFFIDFSKRVFSASNSILDLFITNKAKKIYLLKNNFIMNSFSNILGFFNLIKEENFPDFIFETWTMVSSILKKLSILSNIENSNSIIDKNTFINNYENNFSSKDVSLAKRAKIKFIIADDNPEKKFLEFRIKSIKEYNKQRFTKFDRYTQKKTPVEMLDITFDNTNSDENNYKKKNFLACVNTFNDKLEFINDRKCKEEFEENLKEYGKQLDIYITLYLYMSKKNKKKIKINLFNVSTEKELFKFCFEGDDKIIIKNIHINNFPELLKIGFCIEIKNHTDDLYNDLIYKIRITNYKIFDENLTYLTNNANNFINRTLKFFSSYKNANLLNDLNINESVKELVSSNIFSGGVKNLKSLISDNQKLNILDKDKSKFFNNLDSEIREKIEYLNDQTNEINPFDKLDNKKNENIRSLIKNNLFCSLSGKETNEDNTVFRLFEKIKQNKITFEELITIKDQDSTQYEGKLFTNLPEDKKYFYLMKKLFLLFDFLIEKLNREYIIKGPILDKILIALFFISINQDSSHILTLNKVFNLVFSNKENYNIFTSYKLSVEKGVKLMEDKDFEFIFFIWKNLAQSRKLFRNKKDLINQQLDENNSEKKIVLEFKESEFNFVKLKCKIDPENYEENEIILRYFERYLEKLKVIFYLKSGFTKNKSINGNLFKINQEEIENSSAKLDLPVKKNVLNLKNLVIKTFTGLSLFNKNKILTKQKNKVKDFINNLICITSNDDINADNIIAYIQMINVRIKFREISFFIINDLIKTIKNSQIKSNLISNFYSNFKSNSQISYPDILNNLNISSTEQSNTLTNLFHEFLFHILEEINSLFTKKEIPEESNPSSASINKIHQSTNSIKTPAYGFNCKRSSNLKSIINPHKVTQPYKIEDVNSDNYIYLSILLNALLWNIKGRNFQFLHESNFFKNLFLNQKNEPIKNILKGLFLDQSILRRSKDELIFTKILNKFDLFMIAELMNEIHFTYSRNIIRRIIKENYSQLNQQNQNKGDIKKLTLSKATSSLDFVNKNDLLNQIILVFQKSLEENFTNYIYLRLDDFHKILEDKSYLEFYRKVLKKDLDKDTVYNYLYTEKLFFMKNLINYQKKISNLCNSLIKLILIKDDSLEYLFKNLAFYARLLILSLFVNEKNVGLIMSIMKIFFSYLNKNPEEIEFFGMKIKEIYKSEIRPLIQNLKIKDFENNLLDNIQNIENCNNLEFLLRFIFSLTSCSAKLRTNQNLALFEKNIFKISNKLNNIIDSDINEKLYDFLRYFTNLSNFRERGMKIIFNLSSESSNYFLSNIIDSNIGYINSNSRIVCNSKLDLNNSYANINYDVKDLEYHVKRGNLIHDKNLYLLFNQDYNNQKKFFKKFDGKIKENILKAFIETKIENIFNQIETNKLNIQIPKENEFIIDEEFVDKDNTFIFCDKNLIENILKYLKENLIDKNIYLLTSVQSYIRIVKFLKRVLIYYNENYHSIKNEENADNKLYKNLVENKNMIEKFFNQNKTFFEYFLVPDDFKLPANLLNINPLENIFFGYKPYNFEMISKYMKESLLNFENPIDQKNEVKLFPLGNFNKNIIDENIKENFNDQNVTSKMYLFNKSLNYLNESNLIIGEENILLDIRVDFDIYSITINEKLTPPKNSIHIRKNNSSQGSRQCSRENSRKNSDNSIIFDDKKKKDSKPKNNNIVIEFKFSEYFLINEENDCSNKDSSESLSENKEFHILDKKNAQIALKENEEKYKTYSNEKNNLLHNKGFLISMEFLEEFGLLDPENNKIKNEIFEKYLSTIYDLKDCYFIIDENLIKYLNISFICFAVDFSLIESEINNLLNYPSEYYNLKKDNFKDFENDEFIKTILCGLYKNKNRYLISKNNLNKLSEELDILEDQRDIKKEEDEENNKKLLTRYLELINLEYNIFDFSKNEPLIDLNLPKDVKFTEFLDKIETKSFESQTEQEIKKLGMHILKQHLRFLCLNVIEDYYYLDNYYKIDVLKDKSPKSLLNYIKMLYYQSSFKSNYFNLKSENKMIVEKIKIIILYLTSSGKKEDIKCVFDKNNLNIIKISEEISNEIDLFNKTPYGFLTEIFNCLEFDLNNKNESICENKLNSIIEIVKIFLSLISKERIRSNYEMIITLLSFISMLNEKMENTLEEISKNQIRNKDLFEKFAFSYLKIIFEDESIKAINGVISKKCDFSEKIIDFVIKMLKLTNSFSQIFDNNEIIKVAKISIPKNKYNIYEKHEILENKFKSKVILERMIFESGEYQDNFKRSIRMPNVKNMYAFTLKEDNKFKNYNLSFENSSNIPDELISLKSFEIQKTQDNILNLFNNDSLDLGMNNIISKSISRKEEEMLTKKILIHPEIKNKYVPRKFALISDKKIISENKAKPQTLIYDFDSSVSMVPIKTKTIPSILKYNNKFYKMNLKNIDNFKIYSESQEINSLNNSDYEFYKILTDNLIISNNYILIDMNSFYFDFNYHKKDGMFLIPKGDIEDTKNIIQAGSSDRWILLLDSKGQIYHIGEYPLMHSNYKNNNFTLYNNPHDETKPFFKSDQKCLKILADIECIVFLIQEKNGEKYPHLNASQKISEFFFPEGTKIEFLNHNIIPFFEKIPLKDIYKNLSFYMFLTENNELYYCGSFNEKESNNGISNKLTELNWFKQHKLLILDIITSGVSYIILKVQNYINGEIEYYAFGKVDVFDSTIEQFIKITDDPCKIDFNKLIKANIDYLEKRNNSFGKNDEENIEIIDTDKNQKKEEYPKEEVQNEESKDEEEYEAFIVSRYHAEKKILRKKSFDLSNIKFSVDAPIEKNKTNEKQCEETKLNIKLGLEILRSDYLKNPFDLCSFSQDFVEFENGRIVFFLMLSGYDIIRRNLNYEILENKYKYQILSKKEDLKIDEFILVIHNNNDFVKEKTFEALKGDEDFIYIKLSVRENDESYLITPQIFKSKDELIKCTNTLKIIDLEEKHKNIISTNTDRNIYSNSNNYEPLYEFINPEKPSKTLDFIKENIKEFLNVIFISEDIILFKNIKNENYKTNNQKQEGDSNHSLLNIKLNGIEINTLNPYFFQQSKKNIIDNYMKYSNPYLLYDFNQAKTQYTKLITCKDNKEKNITFSEYTMKYFKDNENLKPFTVNEKKFSSLEKMGNFINLALENLLEDVNLKSENLIAKLIRENIIYLSKEKKELIIDGEISKLETSDYKKNIEIDRIKAKKFEKMNSLDRNFETTIFSQVLNELKGWDKKHYLKDKNTNLFKVDLIGENAQDYGGPGREIFSLIFEDLMSNRLDLFIPTPNQVTKTGLGRDLFTINPNAKTDLHLKCFEFIGNIFAYSFISKVYSPINLPNFVWKAILEIDNKPEDLEEIDVIAYNSIVKVCLNPEQNYDSLFALYDCTNFTATLSNGEEVELCPLGKDKMLTEDNYKEFIKLYLETRFREIREQATAIRKGFT